MTKTVFYAWQNQLPAKGNRTLIEDALEGSLRDLATEAGGAIQATLDQDARGAVGAVEISTVLLEKIANASFFVADVTPVGKLINDKPSPNPNVLFELGYAWCQLPPERITFVFNAAFGAIDELPFDISKRNAIIYRYKSKEDGAPGKARNQLRGQFRTAVGVALQGASNEIASQEEGTEARARREEVLEGRHKCRR